MTETAQRFRLQRDGAAGALAFTGAKLAEDRSSTAKGNLAARWHELALYRTAGGTYVAHVRYRTVVDREAPLTYAQTFDSLSDFAAWAETLPVDDDVVGYPPSPRYAKRQEILLEDLRRGWDALVGRVLHVAGASEEIP